MQGIMTVELGPPPAVRSGSSVSTPVCEIGISEFIPVKAKVHCPKKDRPGEEAVSRGEAKEDELPEQRAIARYQYCRSLCQTQLKAQRRRCVVRENATDQAWTIQDESYKGHKKEEVEGKTG